MANVPKPKSSKGAPPPVTKTIGNLEKPEPTGLAALNFKVPPELKHEYKLYAATKGISMLQLLREGFEVVKEHRG
jgi:hypothetical protein